MKRPTNYEEALLVLTKPFPVEAINFREERTVLVNGKKLYKLAPYLDTRYIIQRLNIVVPGNWNLETEISEIKNFSFDMDKSAILGFYAKTTLRIFDVKHSDVGSTYLPYMSQEDLRKQIIKLDPKVAVTDSIRRVAALHGIGAYFWLLKKTLYVEEKIDNNRNYEKIPAIKEYINYINSVAHAFYMKQKQFVDTVVSTPV